MRRRDATNCGKCSKTPLSYLKADFWRRGFRWLALRHSDVDVHYTVFVSFHCTVHKDAMHQILRRTMEEPTRGVRLIVPLLHSRNSECRRMSEYEFCLRPFNRFAVRSSVVTSSLWACTVQIKRFDIADYIFKRRVNNLLFHKICLWPYNATKNNFPNFNSCAPEPSPI